MNQTTPYTNAALICLDDLESKWLHFGRAADCAIKTEGATLRSLAIKKWGSPEQEDRLGRYHQAALFIDSISESHPLYEHCKAHCSYNHFAELAKIRANTDAEHFQDIFEQFFIRNVSEEIIKCHSVDWLRGKVASIKGVDTPPEQVKRTAYFAIKRVLNDEYSRIERLGLAATRKDRRVLRLLKVIIAVLDTEPEQAARTVTR